MSKETPRPVPKYEMPKLPKDNWVVNKKDKVSFIAALALHIGLLLLLFISLEKTVFIPAENQNAAPKIIEASLVNHKTVKQDIERKEAKRRLKVAQVQKEKEKIEAEKESEQQKQLQDLKLIEKEAEIKRIKEEKEKLAQDQKLLDLATEKAKEKEKEKEKIEQAKELKKQKELALKEKAEKDQKAKAEKDKAKKEKAEKELAEKKLKAKEEQAKREEELAQTLKAEKESLEREVLGKQVKQTQITHYSMLMRNKIHQNWRQPIGMDLSGLICKLDVRLLPTGEVVDATVTESSGSLEYDRSAELAIRKASPLPMPEDPEVAKEFHSFSFSFNPEGA